MKKIYLKKSTSLLLLLLFLVFDCFAESGVYVGGHIRRERPGTITTLRESGFTYVILFNVNVESDGTLTVDGETICKDGQYVFGNTQPNYVSDIKLLKTAPTSITRIEICIGGWGNTSYHKIKSLVSSQGTGSGSTLYKNFKALKNAIPEIDAVNNDDESAYDVNSASAFHVMMKDLGYNTTLAPYTNKPYWQNLASSVNNSRSGAVDRILIQCYDGGASNNPSDWHINNITLHGGRLNYQDFNESKSVMQDWKNNKGVTGGFFWVYNDNTWNLNAYATATNRIFGAKTTSSPIATFYGDSDYGGYAISLPLGSFTTADLAAYGITNDDLTSLKVNSGYKVTIFTDNNFSGQSTSFTTNQTNVGNDYNDKISSIKIYKYSDAAVAKFYDSDNSKGMSVGLPIGSFTLSDMKEYGINDNSITSFDLTSGYRVELYADDNFSGSSASYTSGQGWLGDLNDKASSIKIYPTFTNDITDNGGILSSSHIGIVPAETIDKITDNIATTKYCATKEIGAIVWVQYESPKSVNLQSYSVTSANDEQGRDPKSWKLQGSNNGTEWTDIDTETNQTFDSRYLSKTYSVSTFTAYRYFRLYVTEIYSNTSTVVQIGEWQLLGKEAESTGVNNLGASIKVFPNPVMNNLFIQIEETSTVRLYNMLGQIKYQGIFEKGTNLLDVNNYKDALYVLNISTEKSSKSFILRKE